MKVQPHGSGAYTKTVTNGAEHEYEFSNIYNSDRLLACKEILSFDTKPSTAAAL